MPLPRLSTFPLDKPFERQEPTTSLSEMALRLVVNFYTEDAYVIGTATVICGNLLVTAKHVLLAAVDQFDVENPCRMIDKPIAAVQVLPGPEYNVWDVVEGILDPVSDIALLRLGTNPGRSNPNNLHVWRQPRVNPFAPDVGDRVAAFGYRKSLVRVTRNADGGSHTELNDEPMISVGVVGQIHEMQRDRLLPFPCYQVSARFDAGMSGGPVYDETGCMCGLVCSGFEGAHLDGEPVSYVTTLWPLFRLIVNGDRGDDYPRGVHYPAIELARGGQITVPDLFRLEHWFAAQVK